MAQLDRRSFLRSGAAGAALAYVAPQRGQGAASGRNLPPIPALSDLASDRIVHRFRDLFNLPTAQNEWGYAQSTKSVSGITAISFPPFACCGVPDTPWSPGFLLTCEMFLDGRILMACAAPADELAYTWYPHCFVREARTEGLQFTTETFMPSKQRAVAESIVVKNVSRERRTFKLGFDLRAAVTKKTTAWFASSPGEPDNVIHAVPERGCLVFEAQHSKAVSIQGFTPHPQRIESGRMLVFDLSLDPGESRELHYINLVAENAPSALDTYSGLQVRFPELREQNKQVFTSLIHSAFTPGNSDFSGHLPQLVTNDEALWKLYYTAFANLLFARRVSPDSVYGATYLSLGGRVLPTLSFPWDTSLIALGLAMLDPQPLRQLVETWFVRDMHQHLATDYVTGEAVGPWYGVNDMAILRCADYYLRVTGDFAWLDKKIGDKTALERLLDHALYWKKLDAHGHGFGDYGKIENLLEVVSTYLHEVPGMNAGNVYGMRFVASLLDRRGDSSRAAALRSEARALADRINSRLYVEGKGWWRCGQPDGSFFEVRHCYDLLSIFDSMPEDLSDRQKREMSGFFWSELHSDLWMRALSPGDADATWNIRPDHSFLGAYPAWPPMTARALYQTDPSAKVAAWIRQLSKAANQGPFGQAHFVESYFPPEHGGAYKCPEDQPYIIDWSCTAAGAFLDMIVDSIFGAELTLHDGIRVTSRIGDFDPHAKLVNLPYQGANYTVSKEGARS